MPSSDRGENQLSRRGPARRAPPRVRLNPARGLAARCLAGAPLRSAALAALALAAPAGAAEPSRDEGSGSAEERPATEFTALPIVGGDSDVGIGGGVIASLARVRPELEPYLWRLEAVGMSTVKQTEGDWDVRYADVYLMLTLPHVIRDRLGLTLRASYTRETDLSYYGMGNGAPVDGGEGNPFYNFDWTHPRAEATAEIQLVGPFELVVGVGYSRNEVVAPADGKLAEDSRSPDPELRRLTRFVPDHDVLTLSAGLSWDTRDDEVSPERGHFHTLRFDFSPSAGEQIPYGWTRANLVLRQYVRLVPDRLVAAVRVLGDALLGQPPFYELARFDSTFAVGGTRGMRGVAAPGYYGMLKLIGNLELRARLLSFDFLGKQNDLGLVGFTDFGRVFADYGELSELDGSGLGLKVSFGGGVRLRAGKSFVLRTDVATSPGEGSTAAYLTAGHLF